MYVHETEVQVRGYELDSFGHVNNAVYLNYLELDRWNVFYENGFISDKEGNRIKGGLFPVVIETNIRYLREMVLFDEVVIKGTYWCENSYVINKSVLFNKRTKERVAVSTAKLLFVDENRLIYDIPEEIKKLLGEKTNA